jgi:hypothetical protein
VVFNLYGDGVLVNSVTVLDNKPFRVNADDRHFQWEIEIVTTSEVYEVTLARSAADMRSAGNA